MDYYQDNLVYLDILKKEYNKGHFLFDKVYDKDDLKYFVINTYNLKELIKRGSLRNLYNTYNFISLFYSPIKGNNYNEWFKSYINSVEDFLTDQYKFQLSFVNPKLNTYWNSLGNDLELLNRDNITLERIILFMIKEF